MYRVSSNIEQSPCTAFAVTEFEALIYDIRIVHDTIILTIGNNRNREKKLNITIATAGHAIYWQSVIYTGGAVYGLRRDNGF